MNPDIKGNELEPTQSVSKVSCIVRDIQVLRLTYFIEEKSWRAAIHWQAKIVSWGNAWETDHRMEWDYASIYVQYPQPSQQGFVMLAGPCPEFVLPNYGIQPEFLG